VGRAILILVLFVVGGAISYFGVREYRVSNDAAPHPVEVDLAELEAGRPPGDNHIRIGRHVAAYPATVYAYEISRFASRRKPGPDTRVSHCFYPIVSAASAETPEKDLALEDLDRSFAVLVKTRRFRTKASIPQQVSFNSSVRGLLINRIESLGEREERLIRMNFPQVDMEKVLILEEDRRPASALKWLGMVLGGPAMVLLGVGLGVWWKQKS